MKKIAVQKVIPIDKIENNIGQIVGLPKNQRFIKDDRYEKLKKSIIDDPEMLALRELIVVEFREKYVVIGGNMRLRVLKDINEKEAVCKVLPEDTPVKKLRSITIKDNVSFGEIDNNAISYEWDDVELEDFGFEIHESIMDKIYSNDGKEAKEVKFPITFFATEDEYCQWLEAKKELCIDDDSKALLHILKNNILC